MDWLGWPAILAAVGTLVLATPVELFGLQLPEPILPLLLAFAWPLIRPSVVAPLALFGLGLLLDVLLFQPLGMWPLCLLVPYGVVLAARSFLVGQETRVLFFWYCLTACLAFLLAYLIVMLAGGKAPSLLALLGQVVPTLLLFPLSNALIQRFDDVDARFR
jgi:rod shape-determining protein MreD